MVRLRALLVAIAVLACRGATATTSVADVGTPGPNAPGTPSLPSGPFIVGSTYQDPDGYIEYQPGTAPLILIAPHGGTLLPEGLPDRTCGGCVTVNDLNTQDLARQIADSFAVRTGRRPHVVINRLSRRKFDANREMAEATGGFANLERTWRWLHAYIDSAKAVIVKTPGKGLVLDLHGHGHSIARLEIGYLLAATQLRLDDATLAAGNVMSQTSIARLTRDAPASQPAVALLNGPNSLGGLLATAGVPSVPSHLDRAPRAGQEYFNGGYNTERHGSLAAGTIDAIQIEHHNAGIRDTQANRARYAGILATALATYLERHYGWK